MCNKVWFSFAVVFIGIKGTETDTECFINERLSVPLCSPIKPWKDDDWELLPFGGMNCHNLYCAVICLNWSLSFLRFLRNEYIQKFNEFWEGLLVFISVKISGKFQEFLIVCPALLPVFPGLQRPNHSCFINDRYDESVYRHSVCKLAMPF